MRIWPLHYPTHIRKHHMWLEASESGRGESDHGHFIFDPGFSLHSLGIRVSEAQDEFLGAVGNGDTTGLSRFTIGRLVRGNGRGQGDAIHEVVILERNFRVVLDGVDLSVLEVRACT